MRCSDTSYGLMNVWMMEMMEMVEMVEMVEKKLGEGIEYCALRAGPTPIG